MNANYAANRLDAKLWNSTFASLAEARHFIEWFETSAAVSDWDRHRYVEAKDLEYLEIVMKETT